MNEIANHDYLYVANVLISYYLETTENKKLCGVFRGYKMGTLVTNGLNRLQ